ncbi:MAG: hypothetical protein ACI4EV_02085 [Lachnospiraceae bacterium]
MTRKEDFLEKEWIDAFDRFYDAFNYAPNLPSEVDFDVNEYVSVLDKCIEDKFDYTIEKYGTVVPVYDKWDGVFID